MTVLNAKINRVLEGGPSFALRHRLFRALWNSTWWLLASWTPPPLHRWRGCLLRCFGADIHSNARVYGKARIWYPPNLSMGAHAGVGPGANLYCQGRITIGEKAIVSQGAHLCTGSHDIADPDFQLTTKPIEIGAGAWVAAEAFIGPGVSVGHGAVIGARCVLFKNAVPFGVYAGNPAQLIKTRTMNPN